MLELQTPEIMKFLVNRKQSIDKTKNGHNVPSLEVVEVGLVPLNLICNYYQQKAKLLYYFSSNKSVHFPNVEPSNFVFSKTYNLMKLL